MIHINQLLNEVHTISTSYQRVAEATGETFNLFSILQVETAEVSTHSNFIGELLNRRGTHGKGHTFLSKFLQVFGIHDFDPATSEVYIEYFLGSIGEGYKSGGRIDILIKDAGGNVIMVENKIYAGEQRNQLLRYRAAFPHGYLIFLTLNGTRSVEKADEVRYDVASYETHVLNWLEECKREAVDVPILRETIKQYINLIKKLTNQNLNQSMSRNIVERVLRDEDSLSALTLLVNSRHEILRAVLKEDLFPILEEIEQEFQLELEIDKDGWINNSKNWLGFSFQSSKLKELNVKITFSFNVKVGYRDFIFGFTHINPALKEKFPLTLYQTRFREAFGGGTESPGWGWYKRYNGFTNWDDLNVLKSVRFGDFKKDIKEKVRIMTGLLN